MIVFLLRPSTTRFFAIASILLFAALIIIDQFIAPITHEGVLFHQMSFTRERALEILAGWGEAGRSLYLKTVWLDYIFPLSFAVFFSSCIARSLNALYGNRLSFIQSFMIITPFLAAFFDYVENAYQVAQALHAETLPGWVFWMTSLLSVTKWLLILISISLIVALYYANHHRKTALPH